MQGFRPLTREQNGISLTGDSLFVCDTPEGGRAAPFEDPNALPTQIQAGKRIGIDYAEEAVDFPWRFFSTQ